MLAQESLMLALGWFAMDALAHLRLQPWELAQGMVVSIVCSGAARWGRRQRPEHWARWEVAAAVVPPVLLALLSLGFRYPLSLGLIAFTLPFLTGLRWAVRAWRIPETVAPWPEVLRRAALLGVAGWAVFPAFTDRLLGGVDARWYAYMLADYIEQLRSGVFPVLVGQSEFAYNGAVHPVRSAPLYMWVAGVWDFLTLRGLGVLALQHLTVITASVAAAFGFYAGFIRLYPAHRNLGLIGASLYLFCPGVLAPFYCADMYMTFMSLATLPWVVVGNLGLLTRRSHSWCALTAAGLVLTWMAHPPTGLFASLLTLGLQVVGWASSEEAVGPWLRRSIVLGLWFLGLGAYYFATMSELPPRPGTGLRSDVLVVAGLSLAWVAAARGPAGLAWYLLVLPAGACLSLGGPAWLIFAALLLLVSVAVTSVRRFFPARRPHWGAGTVLAAAVLALASSWPISRSLDLPYETSSIAGLLSYSEGWYKTFGPPTPRVETLWDFRPSLAVWLLLAIALSGFARRQVVTGVLGALGAVFLLLLFRVPGVSDFLVGHVPKGIAQIGSVPLPHRLFPIGTVCIIVAGIAALVTWGDRARRVGTGVLVLAVAWSAWEAGFFVRRGLFSTLPRALTERAFFPENVLMDRFVYDLLPIPPYFSNSKTEPVLDLRFLDQRHRVMWGPDEVAAKMESYGSREVELKATPDPTSSDWLKLPPGIHVEPGQTLLLRFRFDPAVNYTGYLIGRTLFGDYREYELPSSGLSAAFGTAPTASHVIALRNSWIHSVEYSWSHFLKPGNTLVPDGRPYATVVVSDFDPLKMPLRVESWIPFRAFVETGVPGFVESPRVYLPGYRARVDGKPVPVIESPQRLVMVPVEAGKHRVEITYVGTARVWSAAILSGLCWLAWVLRRSWRGDLSPG